MHGVASQYQHHSSGGHGATHCLYLYIVSRYAIFSASDRNQISTWPQSIVFQFSCAIDRADGCASKVIHSPVSGCAYLFRAQFLRGEGVESAPGLVVGDVHNVEEKTDKLLTSSVVQIDLPTSPTKSTDVKSSIQLERMKLKRFEGNVRKYPRFKEEFLKHVMPLCDKSQRKNINSRCFLAASSSSSHTIIVMIVLQHPAVQAPQETCVGI